MWNEITADVWVRRGHVNEQSSSDKFFVVSFFFCFGANVVHHPHYLVHVLHDAQISFIDTHLWNHLMNELLLLHLLGRIQWEIFMNVCTFTKRISHLFLIRFTIKHFYNKIVFLYPDSEMMLRCYTNLWDL